MSHAEVDQYRPQIEAALRYCGGTHTFADVRDAVQANRMQLWCGPRSAIITEIIIYPQKKVLNFFLAGGVSAEIEAMLPGIESWGAAHGCSAAGMTGRRGWERTFLCKSAGWTPTHVLFSKDLSHVQRR